MKLKQFLNEVNWRHMGKTNDNMSDFLAEIEQRMDDTNQRDSLSKELDSIDKSWDILWAKVIKLTRKLN